MSSPSPALASAWGVRVSDLEGYAREFERSPSRMASRRWLAAAIIGRSIPTPDRLRRMATDEREQGIRIALARLIRDAEAGPDDEVELVRAAVLLDVHDTVGTARTSGIQRVVRETARRWLDRDAVIPVAWTRDRTALRRLHEWELDALQGNAVDRKDSGAVESVIIPISGTFVAMELVAETWRAERMIGLAGNPELAVAAIGYDTVPLTSPETASAGIVGQFPIYLDALARAARVAAISTTARTEFQGWARMLRASTPRSPVISGVALAAEIREPSEQGLIRARAAIGMRPDEPVVAVVGSHEPRKNHLAILQAARILWKEGRRFRLVFVGATSWNSSRFHREVGELSRAHPIVIHSAADDDLLSAVYRLARYTVFPSFHEGFGLPVAESLALGTPVVTSNYGSMAEIAGDGGGAVLIDPRDDQSLTDGMRALLTDDSLLTRLEDEARRRPGRSWDDYAQELWNTIVDPPAQSS